MRHFFNLFLLLSVASITACGLAGNSDSYTLYRDSLVGGINRVHVATFDTTDGEQYNHENCQLAAQLFQQQPGTETKFWCEKGRFHK
jgi:hypothetical protein